MQGNPTADVIHGEYQMSARERLSLEPSLTRSRLSWMFGALLIVFASVQVVANIVLGEWPWVPVNLAFAALGFVFASGWIGVPVAWWVMRGKRDLFEERIVIDASPDQLQLASSTGSSSISWSNFRPGGRETTSVFVLVTLGRDKIAIPKRAFGSSDALAFGRLLRDKGLIR